MLSNGELHALGLALFLPRSTAPESPFRFVVIDDPVQAMDPMKVEGLAQVLHRAAADRQVIVLTHDERLPDALRRLMLPTAILEVSRRENGQVEIVPNQDPVRRYLDDARRIISTASLPDDLAAVVVTGTCRDAIEAACQRAARRKLHSEGMSIAGADERLAKAQTTMHRVALALLGNARRTAQLMPALNKLAEGRWAGDVLHHVREGVHHPRADLERVISDSGRLCDLILANPAR